MTVYVRSDESLEGAIDRFSKKVEKAGIISQYRSKMAFRSKKSEAREKNKKRSKRQK